MTIFVLSYVLAFGPYVQNMAHAQQMQNYQNAMYGSSTPELTCMDPEVVADQNIIPFDLTLSQQDLIAPSDTFEGVQRFFEQSAQAQVTIKDNGHMLTFYAASDQCVQEINIEKSKAALIFDGFVAKMNEMYGENTFETLLLDLGYAATGAGLAIGFAALQATPIGWLVDVIVVGLFAYWLVSNFWTCLSLYQQNKHFEMGQHLFAELNALVFFGLGGYGGSVMAKNLNVGQVFAQKLVEMRAWLDGIELPSWVGISKNNLPNGPPTGTPKTTPPTDPCPSGALVCEGGSMPSIGSHAPTSATAETAFASPTTVAIASPNKVSSAAKKEILQYSPVSKRQVQQWLYENPELRTSYRKTSRTRPIFLLPAQNETDVEKWRSRKIQISSSEFVTQWELLQQALSGSITLHHKKALHEAAKQCAQNNGFLSQQLCEKVFKLLYQFEAYGNIELNQDFNFYHQTIDSQFSFAYRGIDTNLLKDVITIARTSSISKSEYSNDMPLKVEVEKYPLIESFDLKIKSFIKRAGKLRGLYFNIDANRGFWLNLGEKQNGIKTKFIQPDEIDQIFDDHFKAYINDTNISKKERYFRLIERVFELSQEKRAEGHSVHELYQIVLDIIYLYAFDDKQIKEELKKAKYSNDSIRTLSQLLELVDQFFIDVVNVGLVNKGIPEYFHIWKLTDYLNEHIQEKDNQLYGPLNMFRHTDLMQEMHDLQERNVQGNASDKLTNAFKIITLNPIESVFRGLLSLTDCSTREYPYTALDPRFIYFSFEDTNTGKRYGNITTIEGNINGTPVLYIDKIQGIDPELLFFKLEEIRKLALAKNRILAIPSDIKHHPHGFSNSPLIVLAMENLIKNSHSHGVFTPNPAIMEINPQATNKYSSINASPDAYLIEYPIADK